jgi:hypothetical protein
MWLLTWFKFKIYFVSSPDLFIIPNFLIQNKENVIPYTVKKLFLSEIKFLQFLFY